jgi:hypothetical protein
MLPRRAFRAAATCEAVDVTLVIQNLLAATLRKPALRKIQRSLAYREISFF